MKYQYIKPILFIAIGVFLCLLMPKCGNNVSHNPILLDAFKVKLKELAIKDKDKTAQLIETKRISDSLVKVKNKYVIKYKTITKDSLVLLECEPVITSCDSMAFAYEMSLIGKDNVISDQDTLIAIKDMEIANLTFQNSSLQVDNKKLGRKLKFQKVKTVMAGIGGFVIGAVVGKFIP